MIGTIFKKEAMDMFLSWRFGIFAAMLILLGGIVVATRSVDHEKALREYADAESLHNEALNRDVRVGGGSGMLFQPYRRPARMSPIAQGTQQGIMEQILPPVYEDPIAVLYSSSDLLIVMGIVISLGALLLSSDLICGERETGTIRLMTANAVKRSSILLGKWLACLAALGTGILLLFIVVGLTLALMRPDAWTISDWESFGVLFVFSLVYASAFLIIGVFLSTTTRHTGTAAILALMVWTVTVFVIPSLPVYVAREAYSALSPTYALIGQLRAEDERNKALWKLRAPLRARGLSEAEVDAQVDKKAVEKVWAEFREKKKYYENASYERSIIQGVITAVASHTSPYGAYVIGGTEITGVGVASMMHFLQFSSAQEAAMSNYLKEREQAWKEAAQKTPGLSPVLDMRDRPKGVYKGDPFVLRIAGAGLPFLSLLLFNILFFVLAWRRFLRYDIR